MVTETKGAFPQKAGAEINKKKPFVFISVRNMTKCRAQKLSEERFRILSPDGLIIVCGPALSIGGNEWTF